MKRESYTLVSVEGQTEKALRVLHCGTSKLERIVAACSGDLRERVCDPCGLVAFPPEWDGREVRRIRFHEQAVARHQSQQVVVSPFVEGHDPAERDVPSRVERALG